MSLDYLLIFQNAQNKDVFKIDKFSVLLNYTKDVCNVLDYTSMVKNFRQGHETSLEKRHQDIYLSPSFAKFFRNTFITKNLLRTGFESRILRKMVNRHSYYNKRYREVDSSFKKQTLRGTVYIWEPLIESWHWT